MRVKIYAHFQTEDQTTQVIEITTLHRQILSNDVTLHGNRTQNSLYSRLI